MTRLHCDSGRLRNGHDNATAAASVAKRAVGLAAVAVRASNDAFCYFCRDSLNRLRVSNRPGDVETLLTNVIEV
jgi:hypothetical protein